jgi:hypothetical protein
MSVAIRPHPPSPSLNLGEGEPEIAGFEANDPLVHYPLPHDLGWSGAQSTGWLTGPIYGAVARSSEEDSAGLI